MVFDLFLRTKYLLLAPHLGKSLLINFYKLNMKFKKLLLLFLPLIFFSIVSCSSDSENPQPTTKDPEVIDPVTKKISTAKYSYDGGHPLPYILNEVKHEFDNLNRISKISVDGWIYGVTYVSSDIIKINLIEDPVAGYKNYSEKTLKLKNGDVTTIIERSSSLNESTNEAFGAKIDSVTFAYSDRYLSKIQYYSSKDNGKSYTLGGQFDFQVTDGNITQLKRTNISIGNVNIMKYKYDNSTYINFGDINFESPIFCVSGAFATFFHDKLGKKSKNNIVDIEFDNNEDIVYMIGYTYFKNISIKRNFDKSGELNEILMSGTTYRYSKNGPTTTTTTKTFSDAKVNLIYK
ncbi:hypothetical protein Flavo103_31730 [Flavobacterium collinsii]|nr:hypothetical protein Flavo103_31730 [Flavobacterium collinsii]